MKFKIDVKALRKAIMPIIEAVGTAGKKHNINDYLRVSGKTINLCQEATETAIKSVLTNTSKELPDKEINRCCADACVAIRRKLFPLKRVTISAQSDKFVAVASEGNVTAKVTISKKEFERTGYECHQRGQLTLEPDYLKALLKNIRNWGTVVIATADNNTMKVYPESEDGSIRHFPVLSYHVDAKIPSLAKEIGVIDKSIMIRSLKAAHSAINNKSDSEIYKRILLRISKNKIQCIAGNGTLFASYSVDGDSIKFSKSVELMLHSDDISNIVNSLVALKDDEVVMKFREDNEECLIFVQGKTQIVVRCYFNIHQYPPVADIIDYDFRYAFKTELSHWSDYVGKTITPVAKAYPIVKIEADIEKGHFLIKHSRETLRCQTPIRFIYGTDIKYYDPAKIKNDELLMTCYSRHIVEMINCGTLEDLISIEFGINDSQARVSKTDKKNLKNILQVRYPVRQIRKTETTEQFIMIFPTNAQIEE